jgi:hypothetical protein
MAKWRYPTRFVQPLHQDQQRRNAMSGKSVAEKLTIKPNTTLWLSDDQHLARIEPLPEGVTPAGVLADATTAVIFVNDRASLRQALTEHQQELANQAASGSPIPRPTRPTSTATACGRSSPNTGFVPSARSQLTISGRRCDSGRWPKARRSSPAAGNRGTLQPLVRSRCCSSSCAASSMSLWRHSIAL